MNNESPSKRFFDGLLGPDRTTALAVFSIILSMGMSCTACVNSCDLKIELQEISSEIKELNGEVELFREDLGKVQGSIDDLESELSSIQSSVDDLER